MIRIFGNEIQEGKFPPSISYTKGKLIVGQIFPYLTRRWRAICAEKYMMPAERHLDIGCGDGYFLRRSKCKERIGLDKLLGDDIKDSLDFPKSYFDYVTMLAVIEHFPDPKCIISEIWRVLKPDGFLIITTPLKRAELILRIYVKNISKEHTAYFHINQMKKLLDGMFEIIIHRMFMFRLNQLFVLKKVEK